mgnify:CR=1 FL=1
MASAILGSWVVLPEPVSPQTMITWWAAKAAAISSRRADTGSSGGKSRPDLLTQAVRSPAFRRRYEMWGDSLVRPPRGFPADHLLIDDLKRKDFTAGYALDDEVVLGPRLRQAVVSGFKGVVPLVDYLCAALELEF